MSVIGQFQITPRSCVGAYIFIKIEIIYICIGISNACCNVKMTCKHKNPIKLLLQKCCYVNNVYINKTKTLGIQQPCKEMQKNIYPLTIIAFFMEFIIYFWQ